MAKVGGRGTIEGIAWDTSHFTGNFPPAASIDACVSESATPQDDADWREIVPATTLQGNQHHYLTVADARAYTHLRVNIYPDGGIARLRVYGQPKVDWTRVDRGSQVDLAAIENGAYLVAANNQHFGPPSHTLMPRRALSLSHRSCTRPPPRPP